MKTNSLIRTASLFGLFLSTAAMGPCDSNVPLANGGDMGSDPATTIIADGSSTVGNADLSTPQDSGKTTSPSTVYAIEQGGTPEALATNGTVVYVAYQGAVNSDGTSNGSIIGIDLPYNVNGNNAGPVIATVNNPTSLAWSNNVLAWSEGGGGLAEETAPHYFVRTYIKNAIALDYDSGSADIYTSSVAVSGSNVYWVNSNIDTNVNTIMVAPADGTGSASSLGTVDIANKAVLLADANSLYFVAQSTGYLTKMPLQGGASTTLAMPSDGNHDISSFTIDANYVYWTDLQVYGTGPNDDVGQFSTSIRRAALDGANMTTLTSNRYLAGALAVSGNSLYWTEGVATTTTATTYTVNAQTMSINGGTPSLVGTLSNAEYSSGQDTTVAGSQLFFIDFAVYVVAK